MSTARITPRAKQPRCVGRDDSYARFVWFFAQGRLTHEINRVFALSYMGERCFVVVFTKRSMIFGLSRTTLKTRECAGFLQDKQGTPEFVFSENAFQCFEEFLGRARSSDARQFHMNNCCFTAGFRALSPSTLSFADSLGGKSVFKCQAPA